MWILSGEGERLVVNAYSEAILAKPDAEAIEAQARGYYAGRGTVLAVQYYDEAPQEVGTDAPVWGVTFGERDRATLYLDPVTGALLKVRTPLWRAFDFAWGLHIMDWQTRSNFNSWWIKSTAVFGFVFALAGGALVVTRLTRKRAPRQR
ncbi:MAG: hypothetical protein AAGH41_10090 [Pseudomonadota bacterium]